MQVATISSYVLAELDSFAGHKLQIVAPFTADGVRAGRCWRCSHTWRRSESSSSLKNSPATCEFILFRVTRWRSTRVSRVSYADPIESKRLSLSLSFFYYISESEPCFEKILHEFYTNRSKELNRKIRITNFQFIRNETIFPTRDVNFFCVYLKDIE